MKITDKQLAEVFGMTSATVGNYRKDTDKKRMLYDAMLQYYKNMDDVYVDREYVVDSDERYITYRTIRDNQALFAMFAKHDLSVAGISAELEDDVDAIRSVLQAYVNLYEF